MNAAVNKTAHTPAQDAIKDVFATLGPVTSSNSGDKLIDFLDKSGEAHVSSYAAPINLVLFEDKDGVKVFRERMLTWPTDKDGITDIVAKSVRGADILSKLEALKNAESKDKLEIARINRKWKYMIDTAVTARTLAAKVVEAESNGWLTGMRANSPNIVISRKDNIAVTKTFTAKAVTNVSFVGKSKLDELGGKTRGKREPKKVEFANVTAMSPFVKAMSAKLSLVAEDPKGNKVSDAFRAELATLVTSAMELLAVPLTVEQDEMLGRISETSERQAA